MDQFQLAVACTLRSKNFYCTPYIFCLMCVQCSSDPKQCQQKKLAPKIQGIDKSRRTTDTQNPLPFPLSTRPSSSNCIGLALAGIRRAYTGGVAVGPGVRWRRLQDARRVFDGLERKKNFTWRIMIRGYAENDQIEDALEVSN